MGSEVSVMRARCLYSPAMLIALVLTLVAHPDSLIRARIAEVPGARVGVVYRALGGRDSLVIDGDSSFHAASTMKVAVMIRLYRDIDAGRLRLDRPVPVTNTFASIVDGSPSFAADRKDDSDSSLYERVGTRVPLGELLDLMVQRSSNLATNTLIDLVGARRVDSTAHALGAVHMRVLRGVEDSAAFARGLNNVVTARDLAVLMEAIADDRAASKASCRAMRDVLFGQAFNTEIPAGLPPGTRVAHKTGQITGILHDAAIVYPTGRRPYVLVVLTGGIPDEHVAQGLIADISRIIWESGVGSRD
jgi:beta-lactamase class A